MTKLFNTDSKVNNLPNVKRGSTQGMVKEVEETPIKRKFEAFQKKYSKATANN